MADNKKTDASLHEAPGVMEKPPQEHTNDTTAARARQEPDRPAYYAVLPAKIRYDEQLRPNAKLLFAEITALTNERGYCWISNERLGAWFGLSPKTVGSLIQQLAERGYISVEILRNEKQAITGRRIWIDHPARTEAAPPILKNEDTPLKNEDTPVLDFEEKNNTRTKVNNIPPYNPPKGGAPDWMPERFEAFWSYYPAMGGRAGGRKPAKARARRAWNKLRPDDATIRAMATALKRQKNSEQWLQGIGIPYASTWINGRLWEEDFEEAAPLEAEQPREGGAKIRWI